MKGKTSQVNSPYIFGQYILILKKSSIYSKFFWKTSQKNPPKVQVLY